MVAALAFRDLRKKPRLVQRERHRPKKGVRCMGHRLDIASGKNEFDRRLGNFRVQIKLDDEGEHVAAITASILAPRHLSEHQRYSIHGGHFDARARCIAFGGFYFKSGAERRDMAAGRLFSPVTSVPNPTKPRDAGEQGA